MKTSKLILSLLTISSIFIISCNTRPEAKDTEGVQVEKTLKNHIAIYDFHNAHRCQTCLAIEAATLAVLDTVFKKEMDSGLITFNLYDCEANENQELAEEYEAFGTTLAITIFNEGQKEIIDITNWAFEMSGTDNFAPELTEKINMALAKLN